MRPASIPAVLAVCILSGGCTVIIHSGTPAVEGSGNKAAQTRQLPPFTEIEFRGAGRIQAKAEGAPSVTIEIDDNLLDLITTEVQGDRLIVASRKPYSSSLGLTATITAPELHYVCQRGAGDVRVEGVHGGRFTMELFGTGTLGASGSASRVAAELAGSGNLDFSELEAREATIQIKGAGNVRVHATETLRASIFGSGDIRYRGDPTVEQHVSGAGTVRKE